MYLNAKNGEIWNLYRYDVTIADITQGIGVQTKKNSRLVVHKRAEEVAKKRLVTVWSRISIIHNDDGATVFFQGFLQNFIMVPTWNF